MTLSTEQLEELERLLAKATPGPWEMECGDHTHRYVHIKDDDDQTVFYKYGASTSKQADRDEADASLIVAAVNALPALISAAKTTLPGAEGVDQRGVPAGWKLVPVEPAREMWAAMGDAVVNSLLLHHDTISKLVWKAALTAAPKPPTTRDLEKLWPISTDGPHAISDTRRWLARQLMDSRLDEATALGIVAYSPAIREVESAPTTPDLAVEELKEAATSSADVLDITAAFLRGIVGVEGASLDMLLTSVNRIRAEVRAALAALGGDNQAEGVG